MKLKLYRSEVIGSDGRTVLHTVAACIEMVSEVIKDHYQASCVQLTRIATERVDESLGSRRQLGLQSMLETAPTGLAAYIPKHGWMVTEVARRGLKLYQIKEPTGDPIYIVAPNADFASAVWGLSLALGKGEQRPFEITESSDGLTEQAKAALDGFLMLGAVGVTTWRDERGWSLV